MFILGPRQVHFYSANNNNRFVFQSEIRQRQILRRWRVGTTTGWQDRHDDDTTSVMFPAKFSTSFAPELCEPRYRKPAFSKYLIFTWSHVTIPLNFAKNRRLAWLVLKRSGKREKNCGICWPRNFLRRWVHQAQPPPPLYMRTYIKKRE